MKRRIVLSLFLVFTFSILFAQNKEYFYGSITGGLSIMNELHEEWNNDKLNQTAGLSYSVKPGLLFGAKLGFVPKAAKNYLALEIEYYYQNNKLDVASSTGFVAGTTVIPGFSGKLTNSGVAFHSFFFNVLARLPEGKIHPYAGIAPGFTISDVKFSEEPYFAESGSDTKFSYQFIVGVDYDISPKISVGAAYKFFKTRPKITWANGTYSYYDPISNNIFVDLKYYF